MGRLWDISPRLTGDLAVFPGDTPLGREMILRLDAGDSVTLSTLRATVHLGAHVDAPSHYGVDAPTIEAVALDRVIGPCRVVRPGAGTSVSDGLLTADGLMEALGSDASAGLPPRVLVATSSYPDPYRWAPDFVALHPEAVDRLATAGVRTIGVDTPSVDPASSKDLPAHAAVLRHDMTIIEGLVLEGVPEGDYELIALPLALVGFDASPVRAILREL